MLKENYTICLIYSIVLSPQTWICERCLGPIHQ